MLTVYLQRSNGDVLHVTKRHHGQHLVVRDKQIRLAQLYWPHRNAPEDQADMNALLNTVPLMDSVILTRGNAALGEEVRQVFAGLVVECGTDGQTITLVGQDAPDQQRLYDEVFRMGQAAPEGPAEGAPWPAAPSPVAVPVPLQHRPSAPNGNGVPPHPAARPPAHPGAQPEQ